MGEETTATLLRDQTDRLDRDKETGAIEVYYFECSRDDLRLHVQVSALEAQQVAWRTRSQPVEDAAEKIAIGVARYRFDAHEAAEDAKRRRATCSP